MTATLNDQQKACIDRVREALPEFSQHDDYLLAHGASLMSDASHEIIHVDTLRKIVDAVFTAARPMAAVPADLIEARAQGRAEALAIILGLDAESGLDECTESHPIADTGDYGTSWNEAKLRKLLHADDGVWSLLQEAEGLYWENRGLRDEAEMRYRAVSLNEKALKDALWLQVCELPDRNSPEGEPNACIVNREELATALEYAITRAGLDSPLAPASDAPATAAPRPSDDDLWDQTLQERDSYHEWADKLAAAIAEHFGIDIGEHSSANNPWSVALDTLESMPATAAHAGAIAPGAHLWHPADIPVVTKVPADFTQGDRKAYAFKNPGADEHAPWFVVLPRGESLKLGYHADDSVDKAHAEFIASAINAALAAPTPAATAPAALTGEQTGWRCFHCDEFFSDSESAALHFGTSLMHEPACQIDIVKYRDMERQVERCNDEDSDVQREMYGMQYRHQFELRREEEKGYARGLADQTKEVLQWAVERWKDEVANRPLINVHRRTLDDTWRQVIRHYGGDAESLIGPSHGALLATNPSNSADGGEGS
jgi:hypothetical protein